MTDQAFEIFYRRTAKGLWAYLYKSTGNSSLADDLLQEAFIAFLKSAPVHLGEAEEKSYLYKIATNLVFMHWRKTKRRRIWEVRMEHEEDFGGREEDHATSVDVAKAFGELSPQQRSLLWLAHVERYEHDEIASMLGVAKGSVKVLLFRARRKFLDLLTTMGIEQGVSP